MKINFKTALESLLTVQPGLTQFQFEKYWNWFYEIKKFQYPYCSTEDVFEIWCKECKTGKPLGHILGQWAFYKDIFFVNNSTLIPRPETEMMVELGLNEIKNNSSSKVLEIGVGSGAVLLSIMLNSAQSLKCHGTDISQDALNLCTKNYQSKKNRLSTHQLTLQITDRTNELQEGYYNLILCNPPYIPENHHGVCKQVKQHEPYSALYLPENSYMTWMMELISGIIKCLAPGGTAIIEGHEDYLNNIVQQISTSFAAQINTLQIIKDLNLRDRFIKLVR